MYYVEMLRAWRVMRIFLIILGALFVLAVIGRIFGHGSVNLSDYAVPRNAHHVVHSVSADGSKATSFDRAGGGHVVVRTDRNGVQTITVTEPSNKAARHSEQTNLGIISVTESQDGKLTTTVIREDNAIPLGYLFIHAAFLVAVFASILGLALSRENDGHLELAWTKPVRRESYAAIMMATDACAIVVLVAVTVVLTVAILAMFGLGGKIVADQDTLPAIVWSVLFMLSFYGLAMAATASLRRASGIALALLWPAALILPALSLIKWLDIGAFVRIIDTLNPVAYVSAVHGASDATARMFTLAPPGVGNAIAALAVITAVALLASVAQWRRLEA